ncbi:MAG: ABC transporter substrate-binding protein [Clostridia bacterium]|nr:ABC transporter substrate-binding protein [Clostridia bacterium]
MKRLLALFLSLVSCLSLVCASACNDQSSNPNGENKTLTFYAPDGAPALAVAKFINDGENFGIDNVNVEYNVVASSDIGPVMMQGKGDFIVMPVNAASKLYKASSNAPYVMTAVLTHGNLYLMSSVGTTSLQDLKGQVVGVIGQGLVPDLTFRAILSDNGLLGDVVVGNTATPDKITIQYFEKAPDMIPLLKQGALKIGLLPEPACTNLTKVASNHTWTRMDVQELYDAQSKSYPQAVLMVKKSVYQQYKTKIDGMQSLFSQNVEWVKTNTEQAVQAVNAKLKEGVTPSLVASNVTPSVVDNCKIFYQASSVAKTDVINYINKIIAIVPNSAVAIAQDFFA